MALNLRGIAFRAWTGLAMVCVATLAVILVIQFSPLLGYLGEKIHWWSVDDVGSRVLEEYGQPGAESNIAQIALAEHYDIMIVTALERVVFWVKGSDPTPNVDPLDDADVTPELRLLLQTLANELELSGRNVLKTTRPLEEGESTYIYFARVEDQEHGTCYVYLAVNFAEPSDSDAQTLQIQVLLVTIIMMAILLAASLPIGHRFLLPVARLTKSAQRLAHGDLSVEFNGHGFTETEQLAATLTYATAQLREFDTDRKELLANVSHDLKTPLTIIRIYAETIRDVSGDDAFKRQTHCDTIIEEANRLTDLVNEIVELSRLDSSSTTVVLTEIDLAEVLRDTLTSFAILAETEGYTFEASIVDTAPIIGNEHFMKRALYNLIGNAVNYTGDDRFIGVSLARRGQVVRFEVTDTGEGITPDKLPTIWERYYKSRGHHSRSVTGSGSGIGLSIVKRVLTVHNARFGVQSVPSSGSCFWFECDLAPDAEPILDRAADHTA